MHGHALHSLALVETITHHSNTVSYSTVHIGVSLHRKCCQGCYGRLYFYFLRCRTQQPWPQHLSLLLRQRKHIISQDGAVTDPTGKNCVINQSNPASQASRSWTVGQKNMADKQTVRGTNKQRWFGRMSFWDNTISLFKTDLNASSWPQWMLDLSNGHTCKHKCYTDPTFSSHHSTTFFHSNWTQITAWFICIKHKSKHFLQISTHRTSEFNCGVCA